MKRRAGGIEWIQLNKTVLADCISCPTYVSKYKNRDVELLLEKDLNSTRLDIVYIPLGFCCLPMWPLHEYQMKSAYESIFANCIECDNVCRNGAQLCMQFFISHNITKHGNNKWSWLPRLRCKKCIPGNDLSGLVFLPYVIQAHKLITSDLDEHIRNVNIKISKKQLCRMCDKPLSNANSRLCKSEECRNYLEFFEKINKENNIQVNGTTGLFQLLELFRLLKSERVDINKSLCNYDLCNGYTKGCTRPGNPNILCTRCHRVSYCSKKCRRKDFNTNTHKCFTDWDKTFSIKNIVIIKD